MATHFASILSGLSQSHLMYVAMATRLDVTYGGQKFFAEVALGIPLKQLFFRQP